MTDIYAAPDAKLREDQSESVFGSVENGVAGDYELSINDILAGAGAKLKGSKRVLWLAFLLLFLASFASQFALSMIASALPLSLVTFLILYFLVILLVTSSIGVGISIVSVKLAVGAPASGASVFSYFGHVLKLFVQFLLFYLLISIGYFLFFLPGIYLNIAYMFAPTLMVEKNMGIWESLEASRRAVTRKWFTVFFSFLVMLIVLIIAAIPLGIGLIWAFPFVCLCYGYMYKTIFGVEQSTLDGE